MENKHDKAENAPDSRIALCSVPEILSEISRKRKDSTELSKLWVDTVADFCQYLIREFHPEGIFLGGSSLYQSPSDNSDVDLFCICADNRKIRGVRQINGFWIEYFVNPAARIRMQMQMEQAEFHDYWSIKIYAFSQILYSRTNDAEALQRQALALYQQPFSPNDTAVQNQKYYQTWDCFTEFCSHYEKGLSLGPTYYETLKHILAAYCYRSRCPVVPWAKCEQLLSSPRFRSDYHLKSLPDEAFCEDFLSCLQETDREQQFRKLSRLYRTYGTSPEFQITQYQLIK